MIPTLPMERLLPLLCVHGSKHCWDRLSWICDVAELVAKYPKADLEVLIDEAGNQGVKRMLFLGLTLAHEILNTDLPVGILDEMRRDTNTRRLAETVAERLFSEPYLPLKGRERMAFHSMMVERKRDKLKNTLEYGFKTITPNVRDLAAVTLPGSLSHLYYLVRPIRLLARYGIRPQNLFGPLFKNKLPKRAHGNLGSVCDDATTLESRS